LRIARRSLGEGGRIVILMARKPKDPHRFSYEGRITWLTLAAVVHADVEALALLCNGDYSAKLQWNLTILIVIS
jgi:hypothetical protein